MSDFDDDFGGYADQQYYYDDEGFDDDDGFDDEGFGGGGFEDEGFGEDDFGDEGMNREGDFEENTFAATFGDFGRVVQGGTGGVMTTHLGRVEKSSRTPLERFLDEASGILSTSMFDQMKETQKEYVLKEIRSIPHVDRYNVITMISALWWKANGKELTKKNFEDFFKNMRGNDVTEIDLMRYIRLL